MKNLKQIRPSRPMSNVSKTQIYTGKNKLYFTAEGLVTSEKPETKSISNY